jgi:hypothetical protein
MASLRDRVQLLINPTELTQGDPVEVGTVVMAAQWGRCENFNNPRVSEEDLKNWYMSREDH